MPKPKASTKKRPPDNSKQKGKKRKPYTTLRVIKTAWLAATIMAYERKLLSDYLMEKTTIDQWYAIDDKTKEKLLGDLLEWCSGAVANIAKKKQKRVGVFA